MTILKPLVGSDFIITNETAEVKNPFNGNIASRIYKTDEKQIDDALAYLEQSFINYKKEPAYKRALLLKMISEEIERGKKELSELITHETGKPIKYSRIELDRAVLTFRLGSEEASRIEGEALNLDLIPGAENKLGIVRRFPLGIIFAITPWNFPINLVAHKLSPALASGNVVLLKPASASLACGIEVVRIIKECCDKIELGYYPVNVITSSGKDTEKFVSDNRVKMVSFTGSSEVGWNLKTKLKLQKISLELGGNAGVIVDETANLEEASEKITAGAFAQAGQSCISVQRVYVHTSVYNTFKNLIIDKTNKIKFGNPEEEENISGPMITLDDAKRIESWVIDAKQKGAKILAGGKRNDSVYEPTIVENAPEDTKLNNDEVFAPLFTLNKFDNFDNALVQINNSRFGLQAGIFTTNLNNAFKAYKTIDAGGIIINDVSAYRIDAMPYGGVKESGNTREGVKYAIEEMTERKIMVITS